MSQLDEYKQVESQRINRMMTHVLTNAQAESYLLRAYQDLEILSPRTLPIALQEWRSPSVSYEGEPNSVWQLFNAVTWALRPRAQTAPAAHAAATIRLGGLLEVQDVPTEAEVRHPTLT